MTSNNSARTVVFKARGESSAPFAQFLNDTQVKAMLRNNDLTDDGSGQSSQANLDDLNGYLKTGKSPKSMIPKKFSAGGISTSM